MTSASLLTRIVLAALSGAAVAAAQAGVVGSVRWSQDRFVEYIVGNAPIVLSAGHGGDLRPPGIPDRTYGTFAKDTRTLELARDLADAFAARFRLRPHLVLCHLHRTKLDVNRDVVEGAQGDPRAVQAWNDFHQACQDARNTVLATWGRGLYLDLHGHGHPEGWVELGYALSSTELAQPDPVLAAPVWRDRSTIRAAASLPHLWFPELLRGATSLGGHLQAFGYPAVPSPAHPDPAGGNYFSGGYNVQAYGSRNGTPVDGIQLELPWSVRRALPVRVPFVGRVADWGASFFTTAHGIDPTQGGRITVRAIDPVASESGGAAVFALQRSGSTSAAHTVWLQWRGSATAGVDYEQPPLQATFAPGMAEIRIPIRPLDDALAEGDETIALWLLGTTELGVPSHAEAVLLDDEPSTDVAVDLGCDDGAGSVVRDRSGNGRHGSLVPTGSGPTWIPGVRGTALRCDGVDDRVRLADFAYAPNGEFSLSFWFRCSNTTGSGFRYLVSHGGLAAAHRLGVYFDQSAGTLRTALLWANDLTSLDVLDVTRDLRDGQWHHYALVAPRQDLVRVYIDGEPETAALFLGDAFDPTGEFVLGARSDLGSGTFANVDLDEVEVARRPWSAAEVAQRCRGLGAEAMVYPGTGEDLLLRTGIGASSSMPTTGGPRADVKVGAGGALLAVDYLSPGGAFTGAFAALVAEVFPTGAPPAPPLFPGAHVGNGAVVVHGPQPLPASGVRWLLQLPAGAGGLSLLLQPAVLTPAARNSLFAAADAHEIRLR